MLPVAVVVFPAPTINTLITDLDKLNPTNASLPTCKHAVVDIVRRDGKFIILERISDLKLVVSCVLKLDPPS